MHKTHILQIYDVLQHMHNDENLSSSLEIIDRKGMRVFSLSCGDILPASTTLSGKKAYTSYAFNMPTDDAFSALSPIGTQSLITESYCFLPGGLNVVSENTPLYIGVSTNDPKKDKFYARRLASLIATDPHFSTTGCFP